MKRMIALLLTGALSLSLVACGTGGMDSSGEGVLADSRTEIPANSQTESSADRQPNMSGMEEGGTSAPEEPQTAGSNVLIAYFSVPEDIETTDAIAGASIVVRNGEIRFPNCSREPCLWETNWFYPGMMWRKVRRP